MEAQAIKKAEKLERQDLVEVTLRISAKGAYRVYDEFPDSMITANSDGSYAKRMKMEGVVGKFLGSLAIQYLKNHLPATVSVEDFSAGID